MAFTRVLIALHQSIHACNQNSLRPRGINSQKF